MQWWRENEQCAVWWNSGQCDTKLCIMIDTMQCMCEIVLMRTSIVPKHHIKAARHTLTNDHILMKWHTKCMSWIFGCQCVNQEYATTTEKHHTTAICHQNSTWYTMFQTCCCIIEAFRWYFAGWKHATTQTVLILSVVSTLVSLQKMGSMKNKATCQQDDCCIVNTFVKHFKIILLV